MSSFLMNSGASTYVVDPKFPPSEEYNQSSYIPATASTDYGSYGVPHHHHLSHNHLHHHAAVSHHHQVQQQYHNGVSNHTSVIGGGGYHQLHHQHQSQHSNGVGLGVSASMGYYGQQQHPSHVSGGGSAYPTAGVYGSTCGGGGSTTGQVPMTANPVSLHQQQQHMQQQQQSPPGLIQQRSPAPSPTPSITSMNGHQIHPQIQQQHLQTLHPQQQQQHLQHNVSQQQQPFTDQLSHLGSMVAQQQPTSQQLQQQQQTQIALQLCQPPTPNSPESDLDDGCSDDLSDDSHNPVIYPWMKKIHVAGSSKF
jgi:homeobox protein HoxA/B/C/D4